MDEQQQEQRATAAESPASTAALPAVVAGDHEHAALVKRAQWLQTQYGVLFVGSMLLLVYNWSGGRSPLTTILWAACLGGAVVTRLYRSSLVNKINAKQGGPLV